MKQFILNLVGCVFACIETLTEVKIPKKYGIVGKVEKYVRKNVQIGFDYEKATNNRLEKQGQARDFEAQPLPWGSWLKFPYLITNKGTDYLRYYGVPNKKPLETLYFIDGVAATPEEVEIIKAYEKTKNSDALVATYVCKLDNIISLTTNGKTIYGTAKLPQVRIAE